MFSLLDVLDQLYQYFCIGVALEGVVVVAQHFAQYVKQTNHCDLCTAVQLALHEVVGAYAIAVIEKENPDLIVAARKSSPLVIGIRGNERFLASDATPIIEHTMCIRDRSKM